MMSADLHGFLRCVHLGVFFSCLAGAFAYQADRASTETLWKLPPAQRVEQTHVLHTSGQARRVEFFIRDNARATTGVTVFLGDSITQAFPIDLAFNGMTDDNPATRTVAVNRGSSGERIEDLMERMDISVRDLQPKKLFIMVGANDIWCIQTDYQAGYLGPGYERLVCSAKALSPNTEIYLQTVLPLDYWDGNIGQHTFEDCKLWVNRANTQLREVAARYGCHVVDTYKAFSEPDGRMIKRYSTDGVHPTLLGCLRWIDAVVPSGQEKQRVWQNIAPKFVEETSGTVAFPVDSPLLTYEAARAQWMCDFVSGKDLTSSDYERVEALNPERNLVK